MAAATFSTSTSSLRASQSIPTSSYSYETSSLTQLPNVNIPFEDLRKRMNDFTLRFDAFLEQGRKRVLNEHNEFKAKLSELQDEAKQTSTTISTLSSSLATTQHLLSREASEKSEIQSSISSLSTRQSTQSAHRDKLRAQIQSTQRAIAAKQAAQQDYAAKIDKQAELNAPELSWWETYLGCRFEGAGEEGLVRVVFMFPGKHGAASKPANGGGGGAADVVREATFELKVPESGSQAYEVVGVRPKLDVEKVEKVVGRLNETREIAVLLKGMRALFAEEMK